MTLASPSSFPIPQTVAPPFETAVIARVTRRLVPFLCLVYFAGFLDRVNVGFAALSMNADLGLTATMFGFGTGVFFIGYVLFEIPSNLALQHFGARRWLARIMIVWGLVSGATAFAWNDWSFYTIRFLLGAAEAGLLPGVVLYLTYWIPEKERGRILGLFMVAIALSGLIGAPLSALLFKLHGLAGLAGWQWMFLIEAAPAVLLGLITLRYLVDRPSMAPWLAPDQREWLQARMDREEAERATLFPSSLRRTFASPKVWALGLVNFGLLVGLYTINFWMPQIIKDAGVADTMTIGLIAALPSLAGACGMIVWSRHSDRTRERTWHLVIAITIAIAGFAAAAMSPDPMVSIAFLVVAALGIYSALPLFWTLPTAFLSGTGMAAGLALINSISNLGGYVGPQLMGYIKDQTASFAPAFGFIALVLLSTAIIVLAIDPEAVRRLVRRQAGVSGMPGT
ncbi:MFS transporter [Bradyrhizobium prioriisuperbiae]|uniref:MFS transporter n=1 Tax=Bradyrhizobium prioriisuperbiae TaxID=2854389 RepID=UPI0028EB1354|nr:MFS transporter [Bradyrhizobium prioritasuperba]